MNIPKIVLDEAEKKGLDRMAVYAFSINGSDIYSLGVKDKKHWFPGPPHALTLVSLKNGKISDYEDFGVALDFWNRDRN